MVFDRPLKGPIKQTKSNHKMNGEDGSNSNLKSDDLIMKLKQFQNRQIGTADGPQCPTAF